MSEDTKMIIEEALHLVSDLTSVFVVRELSEEQRSLVRMALNALDQLNDSIEEEAE